MASTKKWDNIQLGKTYQNLGDAIENYQETPNAATEAALFAAAEGPELMNKAEGLTSGLVSRTIDLFVP